MGHEVEFKIRARRGDIVFGRDYIKLFAYQKQRNQRFVANKLELREVSEGMMLESFLEIDNHQAQQLMDDLWDCGLRPSEGSGSAGAMKAVERHLDDMRSIISAKLNIKFNGQA